MISVLRIGHRVGRDKRISTHLGLVARAFGASEIIYTGDEDRKMMESIIDIDERWGNSIEVRHEKSWKKVVFDYKKRGFVVVHLTMYGLPIGENVDKMRGRDILVAVGGEKVPGEMYSLADMNIAVGNQPHSEVAALAIFLDRLVDWEHLEFNGKIKVIPQERGKKVVSNG